MLRVSLLILEAGRGGGVVSELAGRVGLLQYCRAKCEGHSAGRDMRVGGLRRRAG